MAINNGAAAHVSARRGQIVWLRARLELLITTNVGDPTVFLQYERPTANSACLFASDTERTLVEKLA